MDKKQLVTFSFSILHHSMGISFWKGKDQKQTKEKTKEFHGITKGGYYQAPITPAKQTKESGTWGTAIPKDEEQKEAKK